MIKDTVGKFKSHARSLSTSSSCTATASIIAWYATSHFTNRFSRRRWFDWHLIVEYKQRVNLDNISLLSTPTMRAVNLSRLHLDSLSKCQPFPSTKSFRSWKILIWFISEVKVWTFWKIQTPHFVFLRLDDVVLYHRYKDHLKWQTRRGNFWFSRTNNFMQYNDRSIKVFNWFYLGIFIRNYMSLKQYHHLRFRPLPSHMSGSSLP